MRNRKLWIVLFLVFVFVVGTAESCSGASSADQTNRAAQTTLMERATQSVPVPEVHNFLARQNLAKYMKRMDDPSKVWYVYLLGDNGNIIGYHVGTYPQSVCTFMTPPEKNFWGGSGGVAVNTAPALDGVYYKGGGCSTSFMFDASTGAMIMIGNLKFLAYDQPLDINVQPLTFKSVPGSNPPTVGNSGN